MKIVLRNTDIFIWSLGVDKPWWTALPIWDLLKLFLKKRMTINFEHCIMGWFWPLWDLNLALHFTRKLSGPCGLMCKLLTEGPFPHIFRPLKVTWNHLDTGISTPKRPSTGRFLIYRSTTIRHESHQHRIRHIRHTVPERIMAAEEKASALKEIPRDKIIYDLYAICSIFSIFTKNWIGNTTNFSSSLQINLY